MTYGNSSSMNVYNNYNPGYNYNTGSDYSYSGNYYPSYSSNNNAYYNSQPFYQNAYGQISQQGGMYPTGNPCLYNAGITWSTQNTNYAQVTVRNPDTGVEELFASGLSGSQNANWIQPGKQYRFTLWNSGSGLNQLAQTVVYMGGGCNDYTQAPVSAPYRKYKSGNTYYPPTNPSYGYASGSNLSVSIIDYAFTPRDLIIPNGATVTWTNTGAMPHTVTANDGSFNSGTLNPGQSYSHTFNYNPDMYGTRTYHCTIHPNMVGTITVQDPSIYQNVISSSPSPYSPNTYYNGSGYGY